MTAKQFLEALKYKTLPSKMFNLIKQLITVSLFSDGYRFLSVFIADIPKRLALNVIGRRGKIPVRWYYARSRKRYSGIA